MKSNKLYSQRQTKREVLSSLKGQSLKSNKRHKGTQSIGG